MAIDDAAPDRESLIRRYTLLFGAVAVFVALIATLIAYLRAPANAIYLGHQTSFDDHMVYAAWMRQAMEGRLLFDNRFTTDPQPGLTIHLYFLALGWVAKLIGQVAAVTLARVGFSFLFIWLLGRWLTASGVSVYISKAALALATFGGGIGFLCFTYFGKEITDKSSPIAGLTGGWLPIDVWQPEAFVFPSMLTNSLFMVSLCLILVILRSVVEARHSSKPVLGGALAMLVLMNIHSYDVLLLTLVLVGFLVATVARKRFEGPWLGRALLIGLGAVPSALWFLYVLSQDKVFQARAETLTYSPTLQQVIAGVLPLIIVALMGLAFGADRRRKVGAAATAAFVLGLYVWSTGADPGKEFMRPAAFCLTLAIACVLLTQLATDDDFKNLMWSWALVGLVAPYFPALFQRKLAIGLAVPWAVVAALEAGEALSKQERSQRNIISALGIVVCSLTSLFWLQREVWFIKEDVASTTVNTVYYGRDVAEILKRLEAAPGRVVAVAPPGIPSPPDEKGRFPTPALPDLNPVLSGMAGAYTVAGHWSETPRYSDRFKDDLQMFSAKTPLAERRRLLKEFGVNYAVVPTSSGQEGSPFGSFDDLGETVYRGSIWSLVKVAG